MPGMTTMLAAGPLAARIILRPVRPRDGRTIGRGEPERYCC